MTRYERNGLRLVEHGIDHLLTVHLDERNVCIGSRLPGGVGVCRGKERRWGSSSLLPGLIIKQQPRGLMVIFSAAVQVITS